MFLVRIFVPVLLCTALYWSLRLGYADQLARRGTPGDTARAIELTPANAALYTAPEVLAIATKWNPWNADTWIQRGLESELHGDVRDAERLLLGAPRVDHTFKPLWTLANFYARAGRPDKLWPYARACLTIESRDPVPVFDLCWRVTENVGLIAAAIPDVPAVQAEYLRYLIRTERRQAAAAVYLNLRGANGSVAEPTPLFLDYCDFLLAENSPEALSPWNATASSKLDPEAGISLTNGDLGHAPAGRGFDWHLPVEPGISANLFPSSILRVSMDGDENAEAGLLWQVLPLLPTRRYRLQFRYQTSDIPPSSGLHWRVGDLATGSDLSSDHWRDEILDFETSPTSRLTRLSLRYRRRPGVMRLKGSISLAHLKLSFRP